MYEQPISNPVHIWKNTIGSMKHTFTGSLQEFFFMYMCFSLLLVNQSLKINNLDTDQTRPIVQTGAGLCLVKQN